MLPEKLTQFIEIVNPTPALRCPTSRPTACPTVFQRCRRRICRYDPQNRRARPFHPIARDHRQVRSVSRRRLSNKVWTVASAAPRCFGNHRRHYRRTSTRDQQRQAEPDRPAAQRPNGRGRWFNAEVARFQDRPHRLLMVHKPHHFWGSPYRAGYSICRQ